MISHLLLYIYHYRERRCRERESAADSQASHEGGRPPPHLEQIWLRNRSIIMRVTSLHGTNAVYANLSCADAYPDG